MSEAAHHLVETLRKGVRTHEGLADDLAFMAEVAGDASMAVALHNLARMQRVKALQLRGQTSALKVQHGMICPGDRVEVEIAPAPQAAYLIPSARLNLIADN